MKKIIISSVLGIVAGWFLSILLTRSTNQVYEKHFEDYENLVLVRSAGMQNLSNIMHLYDNGNYQKALLGLNQLNKNNSAVILYKGICYMHLDKFDRAIQEFEKLYLKKNQYKEHADWYTGLCYLKKGYKIAAIKHFEYIAQSDSYYKNEAQKIVNRL